MNRLVAETLQCASLQCEAYGFDGEQTRKMLEAGERDLKRELEAMRAVLDGASPDIRRARGIVHGMKGLLMFMGNRTASDGCCGLEGIQDDGRFVQEAKRLFHL